MDGTKRVAVIGAGPAGATAAYVLAKRGADVEVFEAAGTVGGSARSIELWGQTVDLGPQRFATDDPRVQELWREVVGDDHEMVDGHTRILFRGRLYADPLHLGDVLRNLGPAEAARCLAGYGLRRVRPGRRCDDTVESWVTARFGPRLYRHFFQVYAEKLAGIPAARLDAEFADRRIHGLALRETLRGTARRTLRRTPEQDRGAEPDPAPGNESRPPVDRFAHPRRGTGEVYRRMCESVEKQGGRVHLEAPVAGLVTAGGAVTGLRLDTGETRDYDHVVAALPLTALLAGLPDVPAEVAAAGRALTFRACVIVYLQVSSERLFAGTWVRVSSPELRAGRITNFSNWAPAIRNGQRETVLAMEYWCDSGEDYWRWDERNQVALARQEIVRSGLVRPNQIVDGAVVRVLRARPVHRRDHLARLGVVEDHLRGLANLEVVGRHLAGPDGDQGRGVRMGLLAAENVLDAAGHDLWRAT